ncbi:MAG TPA: restriction endonuclease subunit M/S [Desulfobulbaceae bacterium]|nr:restriction endonuclease subunit M/S [Desulfobulbaceae bacterium]
MLDKDTKQRINSARQILVGKVPDPKAQVEQITNALIYKFMDDMDRENEELGSKAQFLTDDLKEFSWGRLMSRELSGLERWDLYTRALVSFAKSEQIPELFRTIFKDAYLPYRDPETLNLFLKEINGFSYSNSENLGNAFEYLLSILGSQGDAGQFRTPRHIIDFIVEVVNPQKTDRILDPACGTAGFLISSYKHIWRENSANYKADDYTPTFAESESADISSVEIQKNGKFRGDELTPDDRKRLARNIVGYDISPDMVRLSLVNLYLHGFSTPQIHEYDTLTYEERWGNNFDIILANPPFMTPKGGIRPHKLFQVSANRSEVLFVDYIAEHLTIHGKAGIIVPEGIIFQSANAYKALRKMLVEEHYLYAVVSLPAGVFQPYAGVKTSILFLDKALAKRRDEILFIKVKNDGFDLGAQRRRIEKNDLPQAFDILQGWQKGEKAESKIAQWVKKGEIAENGDYNLTGDRYRETVDYSRVKWPMVKLGEVCNFINGRAFKSKDWEKKENGGLPIIRIQNLNNPSAEFNYYSGEVAEKLIVNNGDLLFSWSGSRGTSFGPHIWNRNKGILNQHIFKVQFTEKYIKEFLYYMLKKIVSEVENNLHGGVGLVHITKGSLQQIQIPLPPLEVQQEIVAEIEKEQKMVEECKKLIAIHEQKIKDKIAEVWGEEV